jgi:alkaline phosphatase
MAAGQAQRESFKFFRKGKTMSWILFLMVWNTAGVGSLTVTTAQFQTQEACTASGRNLIQSITSGVGASKITANYDCEPNK